MKKILVPLSLMAVILLPVSLFSQTSVSRVYIKGGHNAWDNYIKEAYEYASFQPGYVEYRGGKQYKSILNYNKVLGTLQFIDDKGDTLALSNEETIRQVNIGDKIYFYAPQCMMEVQGNDKFSFAKRETLHIADKQKTGAFGIPNTSGTIDTYELPSSRIYNELEINESLLLRKTTTYYFSNEKGKVQVATRKNMLELFPKKTTELKKFIEENNVDFHKEADLNKLAAFVATF